MGQIERELKYLLNGNDFFKLKAKFEENKAFLNETIQINHYFDTRDFLFRKNNISLRIRCKNTDYEFTAKEKFISKDHISIANEHNCIISQADFNKVFSSGISTNKDILMILKSFIDDLNFENLIYLGNLKTHRYFYLIDKKYNPICLDINSYLNVVDYELEWETKNITEAKNKLFIIFKNNNIDLSENQDSKSKRFSKRYISCRK